MIITATERSTYLDVSKIEWEPTRFPGVYTKKLYEDASGKTTSLTKMDKGAVLPTHRHMGLEQSYVIQMVGEAEKARILADEKALLHELCTYRGILCLTNKKH